jgi:hypothetical protein
MTRSQLNLTSASLIMIDCDIYSAARDALQFAGPLIRDRAVIFLDDWGYGVKLGRRGEKEAFEEFLAAFPFEATPLPSYTPYTRTFLLRRKADLEPMARKS